MSTKNKVNRIPNMKRAVEQINDLTADTATYQWELAKMLGRLSESRLYKSWGYNTMAAFVEDNLNRGYGSVGKYICIYTHLMRLGYNEGGAITQIANHGVTALVRVLPSAQKKLGRSLPEGASGPHAQLSVATLKEAEVARVEKALVRHGMGYSEEAGYRLGTGEAILALVKENDQLRRKVG